MAQNKQAAAERGHDSERAWFGNNSDFYHGRGRAVCFARRGDSVDLLRLGGLCFFRVIQQSHQKNE